MKIFLLSLLFYSQNLFISFFISFVFIPTIIEFLLIVLIVLLINRLPFSKVFFIIWQLLYLIQFSFISYFGQSLSYVDIYLFFTHIDETFESLIPMYEIFLIPVSIFIAITLIILFSKKSANINISAKILIPLLLISFYFTPKNYDASLLLLKQIAQSYKLLDAKTPTIQEQYNTAIKPLTQKDLNIILIIGESMRAKEFHTKKYDLFEEYQYQTIYSGATNTDVSIPLLLNGATRPKEINLQKNLFTLAKQNNFHTSFITAQSKQYLKYIKGYLEEKSIDNKQVLNALDEKLLKSLEALDLQQNNFIVLQMQGQHSPYTFYPNYNNNDPIFTRYQNSMDYSNQVLTKIIEHIKNNSTKPYLIIFTSDHGEQIGLNGKYGHNRFEEEVYKVPFLVASNIKPLDTNISSHNDLYQLLYNQLGYSAELIFNRPITIYGTMINEEDGFIQIKP